MDQSQKKRPGQIITFYSYKGGTGRSMAVANIGCLLADQLSGDDKVLMIDWDLEAPGLHRYFQGQLHHLNFSNSEEAEKKAPGLIEMFMKLESLSPNEAPLSSVDEEKVAESTFDRINISDYVMATEVPSLYLMKAGVFDSQFADKVGSFDWVNLFERSPMLFISLAQKLASEYTYVLIDSRTGLTDTSGICTMLMPERLVLVFTPNLQSLTGVIDLVRNATTYRRQSEDLRPLLIYPLPSRIEASEPQRRESWRLGNDNLNIAGYEPLFQDAFKEVYDLKNCNLRDYFDEVQVQHVPQYAYGEDIAVLIERSRDTLSLSRSYENFLDKLIYSGTPPWESISESTLSQYAEAAAEAEHLVRSHKSETIRSKKITRITFIISFLVMLLFIGFSIYNKMEERRLLEEAEIQRMQMKTEVDRERLQFERELNEKQLSEQRAKLEAEQARAEKVRQEKLLKEGQISERKATKEAREAQHERDVLREKIIQLEKRLYK